MPAQLILEFEGVTTTEYDAVNAVLGIDPATGAGASVRPSPRVALRDHRPA